MTVTYERAGQRRETTVVPIADKTHDCAGKEQAIGRLRVRPAAVTEYRHQGVIGAMGAGVNAVWSMTTMFYTSMGQILTAARPVMSSAGLFALPRQQVRRRMPGGGFANLVIALSVVLGVFNLLLVPMLRRRASRHVPL